MSTLANFQEVSPTQLALLVLFLVLTFVYTSCFRKHGYLDGAPALDPEGIPGLGPLRFFTDRMAYMRDAARRSKTGNWSFYVGPWPVIGLSGPSGRAAYYSSGKGLALEEGMNALIIGAASMPADPNDANVNAKKGWNAFGKARLLEMIRPEKLRAALPTFFDDCVTAFAAIGDQGSMDPMKDIYYVAWKMSMRMMGPTEIYESPELLQKTFHLSLDLDVLLSGMNVLFTWIPTPLKLRRTISGARLYLMLDKIIKNRRKANEKGEGRRDDGFQLMIDHGDFDSSISKQALNMLFTAQINTAQNAATTLCYLGSYPIWQKRVREELATIASQYARDASAPLSEQLRDIPYEVWDSGMPVLYACLKDSIRIQTIGSFCRQNVTSEPIPLHPVSKDGLPTAPEVVPPGAIIVYNAIDTNADPDIYPDPDTWNPGRYLPEDEAHSKQRYKEMPHAEITWGSGKHICTGQKLAKLEIHVIVAMFVAMFEWECTDGNGKILPAGVPTNWNLWLPTRHKAQYRLRYTRTAEAKT